MIRQTQLFETPIDPADVVFTPRDVSKAIVGFLKPEGKCLDPCKGDGSFYDCLPFPKEYCELSEGKDFFNWRGRVDWVIGNPPYSVFKDFLEYSFEVADNVSFLVPTNKIFQRQVVMDMINKWGGVKSMIVYGSGQLIGFPFGFSVGNFHFERGYKGQCNLIMGMANINKVL